MDLIQIRLETKRRRWLCAQPPGDWDHLLAKEALGIQEQTWSQGKNGQVLGKEMYRGLVSRQQPHPAQEILCAKNN